VRYLGLDMGRRLRILCGGFWRLSRELDDTQYRLADAEAYSRYLRF
jgi:hypothetical protein